MTPAAGARALIAATQGARERVLAGTGHMAMVEAPDATLDALAGIC
jgi:pimeloyl-ACP methyl ester carboxylesterase